MGRGLIPIVVMAMMVVSLPAHADSTATVIVDLKSGDQLRGTVPEGAFTFTDPSGPAEIPFTEISHIMFNNKYAGKRDSKGNPDGNETVYLLSGKILVGMIAGETFTITADDNTSREIDHLALAAVTFPDLYHTRKNADYVMHAPEPEPPKKETDSLKTEESLPGGKTAQSDRRNDEDYQAVKSARDDKDDKGVTINVGIPTAPRRTIPMESGPDHIPASGGGTDRQKGESIQRTPQ